MAALASVVPASRLSLANTAGRGAVTTPTGTIVEQPFRPTTTPDGHRHPVTADLPGGPALDPDGTKPPRQHGVAGSGRLKRTCCAVSC